MSGARPNRGRRLGCQALSGRTRTLTGRPCPVVACKVEALARHQPCGNHGFELADNPSEPYHVSDQHSQVLAAAQQEFSALQKTLKDVPAACAALPEAEQERYRKAQQSVVDARRSAQTNEGLLQVS